MKKFATSFVIILGLSLSTFQSFASQKVNMNPTSENPWEVFKEVIHTYQTSNVAFIFKSKAEQEEFLTAADKMKERIAESQDFHAEGKIRKINQAVTVFKFLWDTKDTAQDDNLDLENLEIPEV
jgi:hypothetical protein